MIVCLVLRAEWRGLKPECGSQDRCWLPGWHRLWLSVAGPGPGATASSGSVQRASLRLRSERSQPGSPPRSPPDQCNKLICAQAPPAGHRLVWPGVGGGGGRASCVCCNAGPEHLGCWDSHPRRSRDAGYPNIPCNNRLSTVKTKFKLSI